MNIFRTATKQAIRDIIEDNASKGRYGILLNDENMEAITERVVDLFEMTLSLRAQVNGTANQPTETEQKMPSRTPALETLHRTSIRPENVANSEAVANATHQFDFKLPRKRIGLTQFEREKFGK